MAIRSRMLGRQAVVVPEPMHDLNITPLIDVLLVLLVMIFLSIPIAAHKTEVDLPGPGSDASDSPQVALVVTENGTVLWDGDPVDGGQLQARLTALAADPAKPTLRFEPDANARYEDAVRVINMASDARVESFAFAGNHRYRQFDAD